MTVLILEFLACLGSVRQCIDINFEIAQGIETLLPSPPHLSQLRARAMTLGFDNALAAYLYLHALSTLQYVRHFIVIGFLQVVVVPRLFAF